MQEMHPISTLPPSNLLNITLFSYAGQLFFGLIATDELPHLDSQDQSSLANQLHERVKKMVERGVIERFSLRVDPDRVGLQFTAFVAIRNDGGAHCRDIAPRLQELPEVLELHSVAGEHDFLAKIRTTHARALEDVLYKIKAIPGVARTTSTVVLNTEFEDRPLSLPGTRED